MRAPQHQKPRGENKYPGARNVLRAWGRISWTCTSWVFLFHIKRSRLSRGAICAENMSGKVIYSGLKCGDVSPGRVSNEGPNQGSKYRNQDQI